MAKPTKTATQSVCPSFHMNTNAMTQVTVRDLDITLSAQTSCVN